MPSMLHLKHNDNKNNNKNGQEIIPEFPKYQADLFNVCVAVHRDLLFVILRLAFVFSDGGVPQDRMIHDRKIYMNYIHHICKMRSVCKTWRHTIDKTFVWFVRDNNFNKELGFTIWNDTRIKNFIKRPNEHKYNIHYTSYHQYANENYRAFRTTTKQKYLVKILPPNVDNLHWVSGTTSSVGFRCGGVGESSTDERCLPRFHFINGYVVIPFRYKLFRKKGKKAPDKKASIRIKFHSTIVTPFAKLSGSQLKLTKNNKPEVIEWFCHKNKKHIPANNMSNWQKDVAQKITNDLLWHMMGYRSNGPTNYPKL